tara:strand:+ start:437 stop:1006 length:570 start_codon:yes stop_codon:yes gene_type:complete
MKKLENTPFSLWEGELSSDICNAIITEGLTQTIQQGTIENDHLIDENMRKGRIAWLAQDGWVDNLLFNYVSKANVLNNWFFHLTYREKPQFTIYEEEEHYDWHRDCNVDHPLQRKLSVTVQLSDPDAYEGGDLHIRDYWNEKEIFSWHPGAKVRGTIIIFGSSLKHKVFPVTKGTRYSLVQWYSGPDFI